MRLDVREPPVQRRSLVHEPDAGGRRLVTQGEPGTRRVHAGPDGTRVQPDREPDGAEKRHGDDQTPKRGPGKPRDHGAGR